jgi:hypothetical protein
MTRLDTAQWGADRLRVGPWRGDHRIAYLAPTPGNPPGTATIRDCVSGLRRDGYVSVLTSALSPSEQRLFEMLSAFAGCSVEAVESVAAGLDDAAGAPLDALDGPIRQRRDRDAVLEVDHLAFSPFWRFDRAGLDDARNATPVSRFRAAVDGARGSATR